MISSPLCLLKLCSDLRYGGLRPFCIPSAFFRVYQSLRPTHLKGKEGLIAPLLTPGNDHCETLWGHFRLWSYNKDFSTSPRVRLVERSLIDEFR